MPTILISELRVASREALVRAGATESDADVVGNHLVESNLAGHDSHGVMRIPQYAREMASGAIVSGTEMSLDSQQGAIAAYDAHLAFGHVAAESGMNIAIENARRQGGLGMVNLRRANHTGRLGHFVTLAAEQGMIGIAMVNAGGGGQWVAAFGGVGKRLSTNPLAIGAPTDVGFPLVLDISTCVVPEGKVRFYQQSKRPLPSGWVMDGQGGTTTDPSLLYESLEAAIAPLGGIAGHKGFGLSFMVEVLAGALSNAGCSRQGVDPKDPVGHGVFLMAIDVSQVIAMDRYQEHVAALVEHLQATPAAAGSSGVLVPGEFEFRQRVQRSKDGIEVPETTWNEIQQLL